MSRALVPLQPDAGVRSEGTLEDGLARDLFAGSVAADEDDRLFPLEEVGARDVVEDEALPQREVDPPAVWYSSVSRSTSGPTDPSR